MSAPLVLSADQLRRLAQFLTRLSAATRDSGVEVGAYGPASVSIDGTVLEVSWSDDDGYHIDDRCGS